MSDLEQRIAGLSPAKQELLLRKMRQRQAATGRAGSERIQPSTKRRSGEPWPLSASQERLWILDQFNPGSNAFNITDAFRLRGHLRTAALVRALTEVIARHEALRTLFPSPAGQPVQEIRDALPGIFLPTVDLRRLASSDRHASAQALRNAASQTSFDLTTGPLLTARLLRVDKREHLVVIALHHIISDGWSMGVLRRELATLYTAFVQGMPTSLAPLPIQYPDFADHQCTWLDGEEARRHTAHWARVLDGVPTLELPADRPRPALQTFRGAIHQLRLDAPLADRLRRLASDAGASLFMALLAAFHAVLRMWSGQRDFAIGTYLAGRNHPEIEGLIGFFINNLALRLRGDGDTFRELLDEARRVTLDAYAHQEVPFERLLEVLHPDRDMSRPSIFQAMCVLQNMPEGRAELPGLELVPESGENHHTHFDVALWLHEEAGEAAAINGTLQYNADLFDAATAGRLAELFVRLLEAASEAPHTSLGDLALATPCERSALLARSRGPADDGRGVALVHQLVAERAADTPNAAALRTTEGSWSYAQLVTRARRLALRLSALGIGAEDRVALYLGRGPELILAMLGVLESGAAYVPFDPDHGTGSRLADMLRDCEARAVLTTDGPRHLLPELGPGGPAVLVLDSELLDALAMEAASASLPASPARTSKPRAEGAAYVIYTSGSTGRPKGVVVSHRSLATYALGAIEAYGIEPQDRILQFSSPSFDASAEEIYPALLAGASLVVDGVELESGPAFLERCAARGVSVLDFPTAWWHTLMAEAERHEELARETGGFARALTWPESVRLVILGGEMAWERDLETWRRLPTGGCRLVNTYGPTEATIVATRWETASWEPGLASASGRGGLPIGRPIQGARTLVLDPNLQALPEGVPGELCLGGTGVARGYLGRPGLTAERFVPDPLSTETSSLPGSRLYRTGDRARWHAGELVFLGRLDHQVKVRGFRIELGEIESVLETHPQVHAAAASVRGGRLAAYAVVEPSASAGSPHSQPEPHPPEPPHPEDLRSYLGERLPAYMVPATLSFLEALPRTPGGKIDRQALPEPREGGAHERVAPRDDTEEILAEIFAEVLGKDLAEIGVYDNFFALGGHSLLATQLATRIRDAFEIDFPLRRIFESPTVALLAVAVEEVLIAELEALGDDDLAAYAEDDLTVYAEDEAGEPT